MVQGVEVEVEGERWVTDLVGDDEASSTPKKGKKTPSGWEESDGRGPSGMWRRRRWIRTVRRKGVSSSNEKES